MYLLKVLFQVSQSEYRLIFGVLVNWFPPKKVTTTKMAVKGDNGSLTMDLFKAIQDFPSKYQYRGMVQYIHQTLKVTVKEFNGMDVSKHFWIDTRNCRRE